MMKKLLSALKYQRDIKVIKDSGLFDELYYLTHYPEAKNTGLSPLEHYLKVGSQSGKKPNAYFDDEYYRQNNPDVRQSGTNPLVHFIKHGAAEGRNPSRNFNLRYYVEQHPDVAAAAANPLWHFLTYGQAEKRETDNYREECLSPANRALYNQLVQIEPLLPDFDSLSYAPLEHGVKESIAGKAYAQIRAQFHPPFSHLFVLEHLIHGGASRLAMNYVKLVAQENGCGKVAVILTGRAGYPARHLVPAGVTFVAMEDIQPELTDEDRIKILSRLIVQTQPQVVHNVISSVGWQTFMRYHRQLRQHSVLVSSFFTFHFDEQGRRVGLVPEYFNRAIDCLDAIVTDNAAFKQEACRFYAVPDKLAEKIAVVYTPIWDRIRPVQAEAAPGKKILWAGRLHPDKRPDILARLARRLPEITFDIFGEQSVEESILNDLKALPNINLLGSYARFEDLPVEGVGLFLYTTRHDGCPITIMEASAAGLPSVAPDVGGTRELLNENTGWLIESGDDVEAYVKAINDCLSNPQERLRRVRNAQELLLKQHTWDAFRQAVKSLPSYFLN